MERQKKGNLGWKLIAEERCGERVISGGPDGRETVLAASSRPCAGFMSSKIRDRFWVLGGDMGAKVKGKVGRSQRWESAQEPHIRHK